MLTATLVVLFTLAVAYTAVLKRYTGAEFEFWKAPYALAYLVYCPQFNQLMWTPWIVQAARNLFRARLVQMLMVGSLLIWYNEPSWRYLLATIYTITPLFWQMMNEKRKPEWTVGHFLAGILSLFVFWITGAGFILPTPLVQEQPFLWLVMIGFSYLTLLVMVFDEWMRVAVGWAREIRKGLKATWGYR